MPLIMSVASRDASKLMIKENPVDFYKIFAVELQRLAKQPITVARLLRCTGLNEVQLNEWLKRAENEGIIKIQ